MDSMIELLIPPIFISSSNSSWFWKSIPQFNWRSKNVQTHRNISKHWFLHLFKYFRIFQNISKYFRIFQNIWKIWIFQNILKYFRNISKYCKIFQNISKYFRKNEIPQNIFLRIKIFFKESGCCTYKLGSRVGGNSDYWLGIIVSREGAGHAEVNGP